MIGFDYMFLHMIGMVIEAIDAAVLVMYLTVCVDLLVIMLITNKEFAFDLIFRSL